MFLISFCFVFASSLDKTKIWQCYVRRSVSRSEFWEPLLESHGENVGSESKYSIDGTQEDEQKFRTSKKFQPMRRQMWPVLTEEASGKPKGEAAV